MRSSAKAVGTLTLKSLGPGGKRLFMLSTGTGVAPFASLIRDEETYQDFDEIYLTQTCRFAKDLKYAEDRIAEAKECPLVGEEAQRSCTSTVVLPESRISMKAVLQT